VAAQRASGAPVLDGSLVSFVRLPGVTVAALAGMPSAAQLAQGAEGCGHDGGDVGALRRAWPAPPDEGELSILTGPRVPVGKADRGVGGVHAGDGALAAALRDGAGDGEGRAIDLYVHPSVDGRAPPPGRRAEPGPLVTLSAGRLDGRPAADLRGEVARASALLVTVDGGDVRWRAVAMSAAGESR